MASESREPLHDGLNEPISAPQAQGSAGKSAKGMLGALGAAGLLLAKFGATSWLFLLKLKFLFVLFKFPTLLSMLLMIWYESLRFGPAYGVGFVMLLMVHELGHYAMAKKLGLDVSSPIFIPMLGALIAMKEEPKDVETEAKVAIAGPVVGSLGALACVGLYFATHERLFLSLAYTGFFLNLFNLLPVRPLDGGRVVGALSPLLWLVGLGMMIAMVFFTPSAVLWLVLILGILEFWRWHKSEDRRYFEVPNHRRVIYGLAYFGLCAALGGGMALIHAMLV